MDPILASGTTSCVRSEDFMNVSRAFRVSGCFAKAQVSVGLGTAFWGRPILRRELPAVIDMRTLQAFVECSVHTTVDDRLNVLTARHADAALTWRSVDVRRPLSHAARSNAPR